jgi:hypothetical protein
VLTTDRDGGSLTEFLRTVLSFLDSNKHEIVSLIFVNTGVPLRQWAKAYFETGADLVSFVPPPSRWHGNMRIEDWPTVAEMVSSNKRLVTFLSEGADQTKADFLLPEFKYLFETNFWISDPTSYSCKPSRPRWPDHRIPSRLSLVSHFLYADFLGISNVDPPFHWTCSQANKVLAMKGTRTHRTPTQRMEEASTLESSVSMPRDVVRFSNGVPTS